MLIETEGGGRLWSRERPVAVDMIAPGHEEVHSLLLRWGRWNAAHYAPQTALSVEGRYREPGARAAPTVDPVFAAVEVTVLRLPRRHRDAVRAYYCTNSSPSFIVKLIGIRAKQFAGFMFECRELVRLSYAAP
jgi:hypothetical protein